MLLDQKLELVPIGDLKPHPRNPRKGDTVAIAESIAHNGFYGAVVAQRSTGYVLAGNHRLKAAADNGATHLPTFWLDVDDEHALRILLADNRTNDLAGYDDAALADLLRECVDAGNLEGTGYDQAAVDELLASVGAVSGEIDEGPEPQVDRAEELREKWSVEPGQLWQIGRHRLLCGDSTVATDVERLLDGAEPNLMVTDPPYGVDYDPEWRAEAGVNKNRGKMGSVQNDSRADWREAWALFPGAVAYVWHAGKFSSTVQESIEACGFEARSQIIWAKDRFALSRGNYHWQHEPCWYAVRKGATANWQGDRKQTTLWQIPARDDSGHGHGTQKPVECMARPIRNHCTKGEAIYEPFSGSGTTFVAAEQLGVNCYGIEIEPKYVAVILQRMSEMGLEPELLNG